MDAEIRRQDQAANTQKIVFEVNYTNDNINNQVEILPKNLSASDTESPK